MHSNVLTLTFKIIRRMRFKNSNVSSCNIIFLTEHIVILLLPWKLVAKKKIKPDQSITIGTTHPILNSRRSIHRKAWAAKKRKQRNIIRDFFLARQKINRYTTEYLISLVQKCFNLGFLFHITSFHVLVTSSTLPEPTATSKTYYSIQETSGNRLHVTVTEWLNSNNPNP